MSFLSTLEFSARIFASSAVFPDAEPVVTPRPDDCAVPREFVPRGEFVALGEAVLLPAIPVVAAAVPLPEPPAPLWAMAESGISNRLAMIRERGMPM
ncbi:MAG TPA: hypothetical protein VJR30_02010 [Bradyrhizobium sp.]|nr:hypothetical protein [Bradyrhizobium sp.]